MVPYPRVHTRGWWANFVKTWVILMALDDTRLPAIGKYSKSQICRQNQLSGYVKFDSRYRYMYSYDQM